MDKKHIIVVECKRVKFYSSYDEDAFFEWLQKIKSIMEVKGKKDSLFLTINSKGLPEDDLYNLVALCRRYKIKTIQLNAIINESNSEQFAYYQHAEHINVYPADQD